MKISLRPIISILLVFGLAGLVLERAKAGGGHFFPPVADKLTMEECGSCHLAYPAAMLPAASWEKMMGNLQQHFGEDASLDAQSKANITRYLTERAGDMGGRSYGRKLLKGVSAKSAPQRITALPKWEKEHRKITPQKWASVDVRSKANCAACHKDAERGYFEDD